MSSRDATSDTAKKEEQARCDDCGHICPVSKLRTPERLSERLDPGGIVPSGECPECGALAYPVGNIYAEGAARVGTLNRSRQHHYRHCFRASGLLQRMKAAEQIRLDIGATAEEIREHDERGAELRKQLGRALTEARDHPDMTLEEGRQTPEKEIPRQTANRLIREASE